MDSFAQNKWCMCASSTLHERCVPSLEVPTCYLTFPVKHANSNASVQWRQKHTHTQSPSRPDLIEAQRSAPGHSLIPLLF